MKIRCRFWSVCGKRFEAAWDTSRRALADEKITEGALRQLGGQGAYSLLGRAEEEVAELERDLAAETLQVKAVRLLFDTLNECRAEMTAGLVAPVEKKANYILQRIAGKRLGPLKLNAGLSAPEVLPDLAERGSPGSGFRRRTGADLPGHPAGPGRTAGRHRAPTGGPGRRADLYRRRPHGPGAGCPGRVRPAPPDPDYHLPPGKIPWLAGGPVCRFGGVGQDGGLRDVNWSK